MARLYDDERMKTLILFLLNELDNEYEFDTISEIIAWDGTINYFVFNDCFFKLVETGAICKREDPYTKKMLYYLSPIGKELLETVEDNLLHYLKAKIMRSATRYLAFKKTGSTIKADYQPCGDGFLFNCRIDNTKRNLMDLTLYLDNKEEAERMKEGFDERSENVYGGILGLLMGDFRFFSK